MIREHELIARKTLLFSNAPRVVVDSLLERATIATTMRGATIFSQD